MITFSSIQLFSHVQLFAIPWTVAHQASLSITNSRSLLKLMFIKLVMSSNHLILCHPLLLLPSIFPSIRVFSSDSVLCIRWPKYWSFSFSISPSNEYSELIFFRIDEFDLLAVQGTLKNLPTPQFKSINSLALSFLYGPIKVDQGSPIKEKENLTRNFTKCRMSFSCAFQIRSRDHIYYSLMGSRNWALGSDIPELASQPY